MMYTHGDHVKITFPADHGSAQINDMTGKIVRPQYAADGEVAPNLVWLNDVWGSVGIADEHLVRA